MITIQLCNVCLDNYTSYECDNCQYSACKSCYETYYKHVMFQIKCMNCNVIFKKKNYKYIVSKDYIKEHNLQFNVFRFIINSFKDHMGRKYLYYSKDEHDKINDKHAEKNYIRNCPRCNMPFQKNNGCGHMTCPLCKHEFSYYRSKYNYRNQSIKKRYTLDSRYICFS